MKKFLEELAKSNRQYVKVVPKGTEAQAKFRELKEKYINLIGKRAMYTCKSQKDMRVVTIESVTNHYVLLSHKYYGMNYKGIMRTCVTFGALICGDDRIDVE